MTLEKRERWGTLIGSVAVPATLAAVLAVTCVCLIPEKILGGDFICFYASGQVVRAGGNPYDPATETIAQSALGWDRNSDGMGVYAFMPYYYPPWFALMCVPFTALGYADAKFVWLCAGFFLMIVTGRMLLAGARGLPPSMIRVMLPVFAPSMMCVFYGQTTPLVLFLVVAAWRWLETGRDRLAGLALALLTIKPQLTAILLLGSLIWSARQRRWGVIWGFGLTLAGLVAVSSILLPTWPVDFLRAPRETPLPTDAYPWLGATWFLVLRSLGVEGWTLRLLYASVATLFLADALRRASDRRSSVRDLFAASLLASFFVAPYGQPYDFMVLLLPMLALVDGRLPEKAAAALLVAILVLPHLQLAFGPALRLWVGRPELPLRVAFFWMPTLIAAAWGFSARWMRPVAG